MKKFWCNYKYLLALAATSFSLALTGCSNNDVNIKDIAIEEDFNLKMNLEDILTVNMDAAKERINFTLEEQKKEEARIENEYRKLKLFLDEYAKDRLSSKLISLSISDLNSIKFTTISMDEEVESSISDVNLTKENIEDIINIINNNINSLKELTITNCNLESKDLSEINFNQMENLTKINLSNNNITDISFIGLLEHLTYINLSHNKIEDPSPLRGKKFRKVYYLDLSYNEISNASLVPSLLMLGVNNEYEIYYHLVHNKFDSSQYQVLYNYFELPLDVNKIYYEGNTECFMYVSLLDKDVDTNKEIATTIIESCIEKTLTK